MFFDTFKELCDAKGVSPKRAVTDMGLSNSIATKWKKTGATPSTETLVKIADYFDVPMPSLLPKNTWALGGNQTTNRIAETILQIVESADQSIKKDLPKEVDGEISEIIKKMPQTVSNFFLTGAPDELDEVEQFIEWLVSRREKREGGL